MSQMNLCFDKWHFFSLLKNFRNKFKVAKNDQKRKKKININASSEAILRNTFTFELRIYEKKVRRNLAFGEKALFLHFASNTGISRLSTLSAAWTFAKFSLIKEENF